MQNPQENAPSDGFQDDATKTLISVLQRQRDNTMNQLAYAEAQLITMESHLKQVSRQQTLLNEAYDGLIKAHAAMEEELTTLRNTNAQLVAAIERAKAPQQDGVVATLMTADNPLAAVPSTTDKSPSSEPVTARGSES